MTSLSYLKGGDAVINSRAEKARIFNEYVKANKEAGVESNPADLDNLRMSLAGGDPFAASMIPAGDALKEFTNRANEQARNAQMKTQTERWAMQDTKDKYTQQIFDDNYYRDPADFPKIFADAFGEEEGMKVYDQYKPVLDDKLNESVGKQYAKIKENPASQYLLEPEDLDRLFPTQAKNPSMRKILESVRQDNQRARNKTQYKDTMDVLKDTPDFVASSPEGQQWWGTMAANGMGYSDPSQVPNPAQFKTGQNLAFTQAQAAQQAKVTQLAAKDPYFAMAAQNGDEDSLFAATTSLMVQAGMAAPKDKTDPSYQNIKKSLELVSRTAAVNEYNKKESDLKAAAIEEAEAMTKGQKARMDAAGQATFIGKEFSNGKSGSDADVDERLKAALSLVNNDPSFFGSPENTMAAVNFMRDEFLSDKKAFDPTAAYGKFMSEGQIDTKASWIDRRTSSQIQGNGLLRPGANFRAQMDNRKSQISSTVNTAFAALNKPVTSTDEYTSLMNNKAIIVQRLRSQLNEIRTSINTLNNDPAVRGNVTGFDYQSSLRDMEVLENSIQQIEKFNPVPPAGANPSYQPQSVQPQDVEASLASSKLKLDEAQARLNGSYRAPQIERNFWGNPVEQGPVLPTGSKSPDPLKRPAPYGRNSQGIPYNKYGEPMYLNGDERPGQPSTVTTITPMSYESVASVPPTNAPRSRMDSYLDAIADIESNGDPFARAQTSSAKGLFQFTKGTWDSLVQRYGEKFGIGSQDIWNPAAQRVMAQILTMENGNQIYRQTGKEPTESDLYLAHFLGPARASTVINNQGSQLLAANLFPDAAKANRGIFYKDGVPVTVEELYKTMGKKVSRSFVQPKQKSKKPKVTELTYNQNGEIQQ